jgi:hypothetical protein
LRWIKQPDMESVKIPYYQARPLVPREVILDPHALAVTAYGPATPQANRENVDLAVR